MCEPLIERTVALPAELLKPTAPAAGELAGGVSYAFGYERQFLRVRYRDEDGEDIDDDIELTKTDCHFGGQRTWYVCYFCGRRTRALYRPAGQSPVRLPAVPSASI